MHLLRSAEVDALLGDASMAKRVLGWAPETSFIGLVHEMVDADLQRYSTGLLLIERLKQQATDSH